MTKTISFSFNVFNGNEIIAQDSLNYKLSEKELREVAAVMDGNGGHRVDLCALEKLTAAIEEEIYVNSLPEIIPEDVDLEGVYVQLQESMPEELVSAADEFVRLKEVTIVYYIQKNGEELKREGQFGISPKDYVAMKKTALSEDERESDFALMKKLYPREYHNVAELVEENGYKECVRDFEQGYPVVLREFPFQVFLNL
jgi:hypothetical protein